MLRGGSIVRADGSGAGAGGAGIARADVVVVGSRIVAVGPSAGAAAAVRALRDAGHRVLEIDCSDRLVLPGLVDAHSHAGARVHDADVQLALLRQGVTTIVTGQDGVGPAPGDGAWADTYFGSIDGAGGYPGGGIGALLDTYDGATPVNVATLVPAGTVRHEVRGDAPGPATPEELVAMRALVRTGLAEGAVGLSTGLDYVPGLFADVDELAALCAEVAAVDALYVTHMRGGYEANLRTGLDEVARIVRASGVRAHVSHLHAPADLAMAALDELAAAGVPLTFDAYPYSRGCTILSMLVLPPAFAAPGTTALADAVATPDGRARMHASVLDRVTSRADLGPGWADQVGLSHIGAARYRRHQGTTLAVAAGLEGTDPASFAIDLLVHAELQVTAIMRVPHPRTPEDLAPLYRLDAHMAGSDGIFVGDHPHPRAAGTFARYLGAFVRTGRWSWPEAVRHLSSTAVGRFGLGDRGRVAVGAVADLAVVDPETVDARATYDEPTLPAVGIDDVLVAGQQVLAGGVLTGVTSGRAIRRG